MTEEEQRKLVEGILENIGPGTDVENSDRSRTISERVLEAYRTEVDPELVDAGWWQKAAKSVEHGNTDQSLVNHVRNGVFALARINEIVDELDGYTLDEEDLRAAVALFTIHDLHKLDEDRDADPESRFDIPKAEVEKYVDLFGLDEFTDLSERDDLSMREFHSCAVDHHDDWTGNHDRTTVRFDDFRPFIRLADAFASSETIEAATDDRTQRALDAAYPGEDFELHRHFIDDVKGVLTNLVNATVAELLEDHGHHQIAIYQDGCVYFAPGDASVPKLDDAFAATLFDGLKENVRSSHPAYTNARRLTGNLTTRSHGFYGINDQDFFYAGAENVLTAIVLNAESDANPEEDPTDSMADSMAALEAHLPIDIERSRRPVGYARLVDTVHRAFVDPILDGADIDESSLAATCEVFDVPDAVRDGLQAASDDDDLSLTAGGKWDYAYGIGQVLVEDDAVEDGYELADRIRQGLAGLDEDWQKHVENEHAGNIRTELSAYLADVVAIDGRPLPDDGSDLSDSFEEYPGKRRGKTCVLCNRGTTSTKKGDVQAPKSLTTLQAGYSNHVAVDAGKPDELLVCLPCQVELSLRETSASRREGGRLFIHLVPDYFYTPLSWRSYTTFLSAFDEESRTELGRLADAVLGFGDDTDFGAFVNSLFDEDSGRSMVEVLDNGFDPTRQYGARTLSYFKPKDNDTEFQFFGVFVALALAAYAGLRVYVSESPIPDIRGRDFQTYARIGGGFTQVHDFYGSEVPLTSLESRLKAAAALVQLGYGTEQNDALFAKFLRTTRNQLLPGSHLLKRIAQADDGRNARYLLEEARVLDEETGITATNETSQVTNE